MTNLELARQLAMLEGAEQAFDATVRNIIETRRAEVMRSMLRGENSLAPSAALAASQALDSALEKLDHNLRCQYDDFLAATAEAISAAFTPIEIQEFIDTLQDDAVRRFLHARIRLGDKLHTPVQQAVERIYQRAVAGGAEE